MLLGGSLVSVSETSSLSTVTVHTSPGVKSAFGLSEKLLTPPGTAGVSTYVCAPLVAQEIEKALAVTSTVSLKLTVTLAFWATFVAVLVGTVEVTLGAASVVK